MKDLLRLTEQEQQIVQQLQGQLQSEKRLAQLFCSAPKQTIDTLLQKLPDARPQEQNSEVASIGARVEGLIDYAYSRGVHHFVQLLDNDMLARIFAELSSSSEVDGQRKWEKGEKFSRDALFDVFEQFGFDMLRGLKLGTLRQLVKMLQFDTDAQSVLEYALDIADEILLNGTRDIIQELTVDQLKSFCHFVGFKISGGKVELMDRLLDVAFPGILDEEERRSLLREAPQASQDSSNGHDRKNIGRGGKRESEQASPSPKRQKTTSAKKPAKKLLTKEQAQEIRPPIAKGITKFDLTQFYWQDEILAYCKEHGINAAGNKKDQIQRVLNYLDNPENKGYKRKGGRGRGRSKSSQSDKEQKNQGISKEDINPA